MLNTLSFAPVRFYFRGPHAVLSAPLLCVAFAGVDLSFASAKETPIAGFKDTERSTRAEAHEPTLGAAASSTQPSQLLKALGGLHFLRTNVQEENTSSIPATASCKGDLFLIDETTRLLGENPFARGDVYVRGSLTQITLDATAHFHAEYTVFRSQGEATYSLEADDCPSLEKAIAFSLSLQLERSPKAPPIEPPASPFSLHQASLSVGVLSLPGYFLNGALGFRMQGSLKPFGKKSPFHLLAGTHFLPSSELRAGAAEHLLLAFELGAKYTIFQSSLVQVSPFLLAQLGISQFHHAKGLLIENLKEESPSELHASLACGGSFSAAISGPFFLNLDAGIQITPSPPHLTPPSFTYSQSKPMFQPEIFSGFFGLQTGILFL